MITVYAGSTQGKYIQVWLNGEDLSDHTYLAKLPDKPGMDGEGELHTFKFLDGKIKLTTGYGGDPEPETEVLKGMVRWEWKEDVPDSVKEFSQQ